MRCMVGAVVAVAVEFVEGVGKVKAGRNVGMVKAKVCMVKVFVDPSL